MYDHRVIYRIIISLTLDLGIKLPPHKYDFKTFLNLLVRGKRGEVTRSKGTQAGRRTRVHKINLITNNIYYIYIL